MPNKYQDNVINGDSCEVMKDIPDNTVQLTVTSPPYGNQRNYTGNGYTFNTFMRQAEQLYRITKNGGCVVWVVRDDVKNNSESGTSFKQALYFMECGFKLYDTMIYAKNHFVPLTHKRYEQMFEYMFVFTKGKPSTFNAIYEPCKHVGESVNPKWNSATAKEAGCALRSREDGTYVIKDKKLKGNIWYYSPSERLDTKGNKHPAILPYKIAQDHIYTWSNEGDLVFDLMCGSGTTLIVAKQMNRHFLGIDIVEEYCSIAKERLEI